MAKVLKKQQENVRFHDLEVDKVLTAPLKDGSRIEIARIVKKAGSTTAYLNRHPSVSWEILAKFLNSLQNFEQEQNEESEIEFAL